MMQQNPLIRDLSNVGEEIPHDLGALMIKNYSDSYPTDVESYYIGKKIIESILAQPGCVGIRFYNALNEIGEKTLVYVGIDCNNEILVEYTSINNLGELVKAKGIVADRTTVTPKPSDDIQWWHWD